MVTAAAHWHTSGTFWAAAGVLVALAVGIATFWVTWTPRQRLFYSMPVATPLLAAPSGVADLELRHHGELLTTPYLVEVTLTSRGRRDIPSSAFDRDRPLIFDLGVPVVEVLQVICDPPSTPTPPVIHDGTTLKIGPELIGRRQTTTVSVLADGKRPHLTCTRNTLTQITVTYRQPDAGPDPRVAFAASGAVVGMATALGVGGPAIGVGVAGMAVLEGMVAVAGVVTISMMMDARRAGRRR